MSVISKTEFETAMLQKFLRLNFWTVSEIRKTESPDFLATVGDKVMGIELCRLHHGKESDSKFSPVERVSMETQIALNAGRNFALNHQIPLHVDIEFKQDLVLDTKGQEQLARKIAEHVWQEVKHKTHQAYYSISKDRNLPNELAHLFIYFHPKVVKSTWYSGKAMLLPDLPCETILEVISKKEAKIPFYKAKADRLTLVLVEGFSMESLFDNIGIPNELQLRTSFNHIYILRDLENVVLQVK